MAPAALLSDEGTEEAPAEPLPDFDQLYQQHFALVWRTLQRLGVPSAHLDDAAQEVFTVVHRRLDTLKSASEARSWLVGISVRVASDVRRSARRKGEHVELGDGLMDAEADPLDRAMQRQARTVVDAMLNGLDDAQREVFVLAEMEELSGPEISEALGVKLNTVYSRLRLAREAFENKLRAWRARSGLT
jgi:RNA polymerase sigma-70 factor (ECF subfamily)